jgi:hypothetical protein
MDCRCPGGGWRLTGQASLGSVRAIIKIRKTFARHWNRLGKNAGTGIFFRQSTS